MGADSDTNDEIDPQITSVRAHAGEHLDREVAMRRRLHEWPEIGT